MDKSRLAKTARAGTPRRERMCRRRNGVVRLADAALRGSDRAAIGHPFGIDRRVPRRNRVARVAASRVRTSRTGSTRRVGRGAYCRYYRD